MVRDYSHEVTAAEVIRNFGFWQSKALVEPVVVTHHGRPRLILCSIDAFEAGRGEAPSQPPTLLHDGDAEGVFHSLMNHMTEGFVGYDEALRITMVNRAAETFTARSREELVGKHFSEAFPNSVRGMTHERLQRVLATGQSYEFETPSTARPGLRVAITAFPYRGGVGLVFMNTTERELLGRNQDCYRAVMDALDSHADVAVARLDSRGRIEEAQPELADWLGFPESEVANARFYDFAPPRDRRRLQDTLETVWETHTPRTVEAEFMRRGDSDLPLRLTFSAVIRDFAVQSIVVVAIRAAAAPPAT
jgi:PAS domain S-box-containing protein